LPEEKRGEPGFPVVTREDKKPREDKIKNVPGRRCLKKKNSTLSPDERGTRFPPKQIGFVLGKMKRRHEARIGVMTQKNEQPAVMVLLMGGGTGFPNKGKEKKNCAQREKKNGNLTEVKKGEKSGLAEPTSVQKTTGRTGNAENKGPPTLLFLEKRSKAKSLTGKKRHRKKNRGTH